MSNPNFTITSNDVIYTNSLTPLRVSPLSSNVYSSQYHLWDFGDGVKSSDENATHVYEEPGVYDVTLSQYTSSGDVVESASQPVTAVNLIPNLMEWSNESYADTAIIASVKTDIPFKANIYNSWQTYDENSIINFYIENSNSIAFDETDKRIHLKPTWRFLNEDDEVIDHIKLTQTKLYAFEDSGQIYITSQQVTDSVFVGVSSSPEFYFVDDTPSGINIDAASYLPSTIIVSQPLSSTYGDSKFTSKPYIEYPHLINSVFVDNVIPDRLFVSSNGIFDIPYVKFQNTKIPYNIRLVDEGGNFIKTNPFDSPSVSSYDIDIGFTESLNISSEPALSGNSLERFKTDFSNLGGFFESHFIPLETTSSSISLTAFTKVDYTLNKSPTRFGIFSDENSNKIYRASYVEDFGQSYIRKDDENVGDIHDGNYSNKFGAAVDSTYRSLFLDSDSSTLEIYDTGFNLTDTISLTSYDTGFDKYHPLLSSNGSVLGGHTSPSNIELNEENNIYITLHDSSSLLYIEKGNVHEFGLYEPDFNEEFKTKSHTITGSNRFRGASTVGDWAVFSPFDAGRVLAYNPITDTLQYSDPHMYSGQGGINYGATTVGDWVVFPPYRSVADRIMSYNPITDTLQHSSGTLAIINFKFRNATTVKNWAVFSPTNYPRVIAYDPETDTILESNLHGMGSEAFRGAATVGDWAVFAPVNADRVMAYNPITDTLQYSDPHGISSPASNEASTVTVGDWAVFAPHNGIDRVMAYNPITDTLKFSEPHGLTANGGNPEFNDSSSIGDWVVFAPFEAEEILAYNPLTDELKISGKHGLGSNSELFQSSTVINNWVVFAPYASDNIIAYDPVNNSMINVESIGTLGGDSTYYGATTVGKWAVFAPYDTGLVAATTFDTTPTLKRPNSVDKLITDSIYVSFIDDGNSHFIDKYQVDETTPSIALTATIPLSTYQPVDIISDRTSTKLYALLTNDDESSKISTYDISTNSELSSIDVGYGAEFISIDTNQIAWTLATPLSSDNYKLYNTKGDIIDLEDFGGGFIKTVGGIAGDSYGNMWVIDPDEDRLIIFDVEDHTNYSLINISEDSGNATNRYVSYGDWNGFRWFNKFGYSGTVITYELSGISNEFIIHPRNKYNIQKINEDFDMTETVKSYRTTEAMLNYDDLFDNFLASIYGNKFDDGTYFGKNIYEKISNFVMNHSDIDTCSVEALRSICEETGIDFEVDLIYPRDIKRVVDLFSIKFKKLWGDDYQTGIIEDFKGDALDIETYHVSADPQINFIATEKFNDYNTIIKPLILDQFSNLSLPDNITLNGTVASGGYIISENWGQTSEYFYVKQDDTNTFTYLAWDFTKWILYKEVLDEGVVIEREDYWESLSSYPFSSDPPVLPWEDTYTKLVDETEDGPLEIILPNETVYPLNLYTQSWGWGLSIPSGGNLKDYYDFYELLPLSSYKLDSIIDWDNELTDTSIKGLSSYKTYMTEDGIISTILGDKLRRGLNLYLD